ncbi:MAG: sodium:solute symporter family protein, partial [Rickettsiaceae bacterium]|nr:sodium:solute symporter family protein [Rickettsiaceae bacterium]
MDIDSAIFIGFLAINIILGLGSSRGIKNIKEYAIGKRDFSTASIVCTIVATWISGGVFFEAISESYNNGLYYMCAGLGYVVNLLLIGYFFAPRLSEFVGKLSIAEAMGDLYGKPVRIITAIAGFIGVSGVIAIQLKISGLLFEYCFNVPSAYGVIIGGIIVTLYSTLGGIKAVTFTDIVQFFTFGTIIPTITLFLVTTLDSMDLVTNTLSNNKIFDYKEVFDFTNSKSFYYLFIFLFFAVPAFNPAIFQRISIAKNINQVRKSFIIAAVTCLFLMIMLYWIGILLLSINPKIAPSNVVKHLIFESSYVGLKGLTLAGIMAMLMSTADSYINSTSVLIVHDFCKPLGINLVKNELTFSRIASLLIGIFAIILCLYSTSLLQLIIMTSSFYMPVVTVPFIMSLVGFRSSGKSVLIGMIAGFVTVVIWKIFFTQIAIDGLVPGMLANLIFLMASHYILQQQGGWVGIKDFGPVLQIRKNRKAKIQNFIKACRNFDISLFLLKNSPSSGPGFEPIYIYLGFFCMISAFSAIHTIDKSIQIEYSNVIDFIYPSVLFISTLLLAYPLWLSSWRKT